MKGMFKRNTKNPILTVKDLPCKAFYILNPGAVKFNNEYIMMVDVFHMEGGIIFWLARSQNGIDFKFDPSPVKWPESFSWWKENGVYDPRIAKINDEYIITYGSHNNELGTRVGIVKTTDFINFSRVSIASEIGNRNAALFPAEINGKYCRLDRPFTDENSPCDIWLSYSKDLIYWGESRIVMRSRPGHWDCFKIGAGAVPIKIKEGWLSIYHGVHQTCSGSLYSLFGAIHDENDVSKVIARTKYPLFFPEAAYEKNGRVNNVVFTCNAILESDNTIKIYYGAADSCIGLAEAKLENIIDAMHEDYQFMM